MIAQRASLGRDERGWSLVELLTFMVIFAVAGAILTGSFITASRALSNTNTLANDVNQVRASMVEVSRVLRTARPLEAGSDPFVDASPTQVTFYANFRTGDRDAPALYRFVVEDDTFVSYLLDDFTVTGDPGFDPDDVTTGRRRVLAREVGDGNVFTFLDRDGGSVPDPNAVGADPVGRVELRLEIGGPPARPTTTVVTQTVRLPNMLQQ